MPWTADTLPPAASSLTPEQRERAAAIANAVLEERRAACAPDDVECRAQAEGVAIATALRRVLQAEGEAPLDPPASARPPVPGARENGAEYSATHTAGAVELRAPAEERIEYRGRTWVLGPEQEILRAVTTHQAGEALTVTREHLAQMAANVAHWPLIPIDFDHRSGKGPDGIAGGVVLPHTLRVDGDRLIGRLAYNETTAADVRSGRWLGLSPRFALGAESKKTGEKVGALLLAVALTNTPQLDEIEVVTNFAATEDRNGTKPLDERAVSVHPAPNASESTTMADKTDADKTEFAARAELAKLMGMDEDEKDDDKLFAAAVKALKAAGAKATEATAAGAKVTELSAERDALAKRAEAAEAKVTELSATATDAAKRNGELAAKVTELGASIGRIEAERLTERQTHEVEEFCATHNLGADRRERLLDARRLVDVVPESSRDGATRAYDALKTEFAAQALGKRQAGTAAREDGGVKEWSAMVDEAAVKLDGDIAAATQQLLATDAGRRSFDRYLGTGGGAKA